MILLLCDIIICSKLYSYSLLHQLINYQYNIIYTDFTIFIDVFLVIEISGFDNFCFFPQLFMHGKRVNRSVVILVRSVICVQYLCNLYNILLLFHILFLQ